MKKLIKTAARVVSILTLGLGLLRFFRVRSPNGALLMLLKMMTSALAPYMAAAGVFSAMVGALLNSPITLISGAWGAFLSIHHMKRVLGARGDWDAAFGTGWQQHIPGYLSAHFLPARWNGKLFDPPPAQVDKNVVFWTIKDDERDLLCDIWHPPQGVPPSGMALIYLHGSAWHFSDKDVGTRPMFAHLAAQGHLIMDVAYRLCPETDWRGMLADAKRAIAWMKTNALEYNINPDQVVIMGGSAGGHLALLAACTADQAYLSPPDAQWSDLEVGGVVAWYGPADMAAYNAYASGVFGYRVQEPRPQGESDFISRLMKRTGFEMSSMLHWQPGQTMQSEMMRALFGCIPEPADYREASPAAYTGPQCPPALLLQGAHDSIVPPAATRDLAERLRAAGVPAVLVEYPETEHAFDLVLPKVSPPAQAALYETERFLGVLAGLLSAR